jgi:hypothetical protein
MVSCYRGAPNVSTWCCIQDRGMYSLGATTDRWGWPHQVDVLECPDELLLVLRAHARVHVCLGDHLQKHHHHGHGQEHTSVSRPLTL